MALFDFDVWIIGRKAESGQAIELTVVPADQFGWSVIRWHNLSHLASLCQVQPRAVWKPTRELCRENDWSNMMCKPHK
jgi:hypothetical protein